MFIFLFRFHPFVIRRIINSIITNMDSITNLHRITNMERITNLHRTTNIESIDNNDGFTITDFIIVINNWRLLIFQKLGFFYFTWHLFSFHATLFSTEAFVLEVLKRQYPVVYFVFLKNANVASFITEHKRVYKRNSLVSWVGVFLEAMLQWFQDRNIRNSVLLTIICQSKEKRLVRNLEKQSECCFLL